MREARPRLLRAAPRRGYTLVEALVATAICTVAGSALLLGISSSLQTTDAVLEQALAEGMAQQLLDELAGLRYAEAGLGAYQSPLGPEAGELGGTRAGFDDLDDFHGLADQPPRDYWGVPLGEDDGEGGSRHPSFRASLRSMDRWRRQVEVYYAREGDFATPLPVGQTSSYRVARVTIFLDLPGQAPRKLAERTRVLAYIPAGS